MPHLTIEITGNLKSFVHAPVLLQVAHQVLLQSQVFSASDIKSRVVWLNDFCIGEAGETEGFVHATLDLLAGRSPEVRQKLAADVASALLFALDDVVSMSVQVSCWVRDMDQGSYIKHRV